MTTLHHYLANPDPLDATKQIGGYSYRLKDTIGEGFSSKVYVGKHIPTGKQVAIKVAYTTYDQDSNILKKMLRFEIAVLKQMMHKPNVLQLQCILQSKSHKYIVTELCRDGDLAQMLKLNRLSEDQCISIIKQIINGYSSIYNAAIIHRDLKPANVLIHKGQFKIADFGFAIRINQAQKHTKYKVGSPLYMAPQILQNNTYSTKGDIWSIGILFYQLLYGVTPWEGDSEAQILLKIRQHSILNVIPPNTISNVSRLFLSRSLQPNVSNRMQLHQLLNFDFSWQNDTQSKHPTLNMARVQSNLHERTSSRRLNSSISLSNDEFCKLLFKVIRKLSKCKIVYSQKLRDLLTGFIYYLNNQMPIPQSLQQKKSLKGQSNIWNKISCLLRQYENKYLFNLGKLPPLYLKQLIQQLLHNINYINQKLHTFSLLHPDNPLLQVSRLLTTVLELLYQHSSFLPIQIQIHTYPKIIITDASCS